MAVYKLQNLDFGIAERSRAVREAGVEFSDQWVASEKKVFWASERTANPGFGPAESGS